MNICTVYGCKNKAVARGYCSKHWQRWRTHGNADVIVKEFLPETCEVPGCHRKPHTRWRGKAVCNMHWQRLYSHGDATKREKVFNQWSVCSVNGCDKPARSPGKNVMCEMHYMRNRRTGTTDIIKREIAERYSSSGYVTSSNKDHPLASSRNGFLYEHRKILFNKIGWGPHSCHWCGTEIDWMPGERTKKGALVVDHLNGNKSDNNENNLIPSCHRCNAMRGLFQKWVMEHGSDAIILIEQWMSQHKKKAV